MFKTISKLFRSEGPADHQKNNGMSFIYSAIAFLVILGPFLFIPASGLSIAAGKGFIILFLVIAMIAVFGVHVLRKGEVTIPRQGIFIFLAVIVVGGLVGSIFSPAFSASLFGYGFETTTWVFTGILAVLMLFSRLVITTHDRTGTLYAGMFVAGIIMMIFQVVRFIVGPMTANLGVLTFPTATLIGSWGDFAIFLGLIAIASVVTLELVALKRSIKWFVATVGIFSVILLAFINVKVVWIVVGLTALIIALYLFSFAYWNPSEKSYTRKNRIPGYALGLLAIAVVALFFGGLLNGFASRHQNISFNDVRPSISATAQVAVKSIFRNPVTGYGPNLFAAPWALVRPASLSGTPISTADFGSGVGYVPGQIATNGIVGIIGWVGFFILLGMTWWRTMSRGFENPFDRFFTVSLGFLVAYLGIIAWVYVPGSYILIGFAVLIGAFLATGNNNQEKTFSFIRDPRASFFGIIAIMILLVAAALGGYVGVRKMVSWIQYHRGLVLLDGGDIPGGTLALNRAAAFASLDVYHNQLAGIGTYQLNQVVSNSQSKEAASQQAQQILGTILGHAQAAVDANPSSYKNWILLGDAYRAMVTLGVADAYERARAAYQQAADRNPNDSTMLLSFAQLDLANNNTAGALEFIKQSIDKYPTSRAYVIRAQIELAKDETTATLASLGTAVQLDPSNATLAYQYGLLLFTQKKYDSAIIAFQRAILADRSYGAAYVYLGVSYEKTGDMASAEKVYDFVKKQFTDGADAIAKVKSGILDAPAPEQAAPNVAPEPKTVAPAPKKP